MKNIEEARLIAAQCWTDDETSNKTMDPVLAEAVAKRIARWMRTADEYATNTEFYRDLVHKCAHRLGPLKKLAFTADDGSETDSPLSLKVPELVEQLAYAAQYFLRLGPEFVGAITVTNSDIHVIRATDGKVTRVGYPSTTNGIAEAARVLAKWMDLKPEPTPDSPAVEPNPFSDLPIK